MLIFPVLTNQTPHYPDVHLSSQETNLKELAEYDKSQNKDHPIILSDDEDKEHLENSSDNIAASNPNQEPPQDSDICQLIEECSIEVCKEQKQNMENTVRELVEICHQKELLCIHNNVDDLIESALNSKLLSINSKSQHPDRVEKSLQNFKIFFLVLQCI
nr:hypothetical protein [Tanacetum cinerariifolium]